MNSDPFLNGLKSVLKMRAITYDDVSKQLGVSQSTVKRWFSSGGMSLDQYAQVMTIAKVSFFDLAKLVDAQAEAETYIYTEEQEAFFIKHPASHAFFHLLLQHGSVAEVTKRKKLANSIVSQCLRQLDTIGLIEWQNKNRYRLLVPKRVAWRKDGPLRRQFLAEAKGEFLHSNFSGRQSGFRFLNIRLTEKTATDLVDQYAKIANELGQTSEIEKATHRDLEDYGILMAVRPWIFSKLVI